MRCAILVLLVGACLALDVDEREIVEGLPGGLYDGDIADPAIKEAVKTAIKEFRTRALASGKLQANKEAILIGDVVEVKQQVVAGMKYYITIKLGVTSSCSDKANKAGYVSAAVCSEGAKDLGEHKIELVHQPWMEEKYTYFAFSDVSGPQLASYWGQ